MISNDANNIFTEPPDRLGESDFDFGTFVATVGTMDGFEVARSFADAANRLLVAAAENRENWEASPPILFCYRHALELYLKALLPESRHNHSLSTLAQSLKPLLKRYPADQVAWLHDRIIEFDMVDPKSTVFRYHDGLITSHETSGDPYPELWVDYNNLKRTMEIIFHGLERLRILQFHKV